MYSGLPRDEKAVRSQFIVIARVYQFGVGTLVQWLETLFRHRSGVWYRMSLFLTLFGLNRASQRTVT
jgi:hypothetical protein